MVDSAQSGLAEKDAAAFHAVSGAEDYGLDCTQFTTILRQIQVKYLPHAGAEEAAAFCGGLHFEELALARGCAAGNEKAWEKFVKTYQPKLRVIALHITRDAAHAADLADSLFADLYGLSHAGGERKSKLIFYTGRGSLEGWLRAVMAQEFVNRYRKQKREVSLEEQEEDGLQLAAATPAPAAPSDGVLESATDEALGELSADDRYILAAYHLDGRTLAEVARVLGLHESSISRRLDRVAATLRKRILACLRERGLSHAQAKEALETDVRDIALDIRARLTQDSGANTFPGSKAPAPGAGRDGGVV